MRPIAKEAEPGSLTRHRLNASADYDNYADKDELRRSLVKEQKALCCYCMSRIRPDAFSMKIEHWRSQTVYPDEQLDYKNLLGACLGNAGQPPDKQHCDTRKGIKDLSRNPADFQHPIDRDLQYPGDGRIVSADPAFNTQLNDILNLNHPFLRNNRKAALDAFQQTLREYGELSSDRVAKWLQEWSGLSNQSELPPFAAVVVYWLRKRLARAT